MIIIFFDKSKFLISFYIKKQAGITGLFLHIVTSSKFYYI